MCTWKSGVKMKKIKKKKNSFLNKYSRFVEVLFLLSSMTFVIVLTMLGVLPEKYLLMVFGGLLVFIVLFGLIAFLNGVNNFNKVIQSALCTILSIVLIIASVGIEFYKDKIRNIFTNTESVTLYVYTLKDSAIEIADDLGDTAMGLSTFTNSSVQTTALSDLLGYLDKYELGSIETTTYSGINKIVDALYNKEVDSIMIQSNLVDVIKEIPDYSDFESRVKVVYESTHQVTIKGSDSNFKIKNITKDPFIIAVGGQDYNGNFDVNMVATVNPLTKQVLIVTVPRDAYSPLDGDPDKMDKLSYSGQLGSDVWFNTLQLIFDYKFNFYAIVDYYSISDVIDAVDGIDIYNPYYFTTVGGNGRSPRGYDYSFPEGELHLNGDRTLSYVRERYNLPTYDLGRNEHQGIVLKALIKKLTSSEIVSHADSVLEVLESKVASDFTPEIIYKLVSMQLADNADWSIVTYNIKGEVFYTYSYMIGHEYGPNYAMMDLYEDTVIKANSLIKQVLDGEIITLE